MIAALLDNAAGLFAVALAAVWFLLGVWTLRGLPRSLTELQIAYLGFLLLALSLHLVYHIGFVGGCGQTPGRMAVGIAVVDRAGAAPGYGRAVLRVMGSVLNVLTLGLLSLFWLFARDRRGLADRVAGTWSVRVPRA